MLLSKKKPKPQALANYYKKQALVFSKANNRYFWHAFYKLVIQCNGS